MATSGRRIRRRDARLVPVAAAAWLAASGATTYPATVGAATLILWVATMIAVIVTMCARRRTVPGLAAVALACAAAVCTHVAAAEPP
ncbi:MAG: competence protein ComEC, partial [Microbacterium sp.]